LTTRNQAIESKTEKRTFFLRRAGWSNSPCGPGWRTRPRSTAFDCLATLWWVAQTLLDRFSLHVGEDERRARALLASFEADLLVLAILTDHPERWPACGSCQGAGREEDEACFACRGRGFETVQLDATVRVSPR
jgi:hypothetical protein